MMKAETLIKDNGVVILKNTEEQKSWDKGIYKMERGRTGERERDIIVWQNKVTWVRDVKE